MFGALFCLSVVLSGCSIILFGTGCEISLSVKDCEHDREDMERQKRATFCLMVSYIILVAAAVAWGATFFFAPH